MGGRFFTLAAAIFGAYAFLIFHLYQLQVTHSSYYLAQAQSQFAAADASLGRRGVIYFTDQKGSRLQAALDKNFPVVYAVPKDIQDIEEAANYLALFLGRPADTFIPELRKTSSYYVILEKNPDEATAARVRDAKVPGIYVEEVPRRFYPFGSLASQAMGFVGPNSENNGQSGKYGIEKYYNEELDGDARAIGSQALFADGFGQDITLTIDPTIQTEAEHMLKNLVSAHRAKSASIIVADPRTGAILAMGSAPAFDPNNYSDSPVQNFLNPVVEKIYEPGSVFKVLTMVAGIDSGKITPDTTYYDTGSLKLNGRTIRNWDLKAHGRVSMTEVIEGSINTGAAFAERETGHGIFLSYLQKFGFGEKTGIDVPGEVAGSLRPLLKADAPEINFATASFGQGVAVTSLQVLQAIQAIANGGSLMRPYVNAELGPQTVRRVMSEDTAKKVAAMMAAAVDNAKIATIEGYSVAGKTGTAQVPDFTYGGYTENVIDTYTGFVPASNPRFIALIQLNEPAGAPHAAETVVPAFRQLAQYLINYFQIPPDRIANQ